MPIRFDLNQFKNPVFLETGTWKGEGVIKAIEQGFKKIISVEFVPELYQENLRKFVNRIKTGLVHLLPGNSADVMPEAMKLTEGLPTTFWLDAHYQEKGEKTENPLFGELDGIATMPNAGHIILIDDRRLFKDWGIDEEKLRTRLLEVHPGCTLSHEQGIVPNDVLVARF